MVKLIQTMLVALLMVFGFFIYQKAHAVTKFNVPVYFLQSSEWNNLKRQINSVADYVELQWEGHGGYNYMANDFSNYVNYINRTYNNKIHIKVVGQSISNHAMVLCYVDNVKRTKNGVLIFHASFNNVSGPKQYEPAYETQRRMGPCIKKGYLNKYDVNLIAYKHVRIEVYPNGKKVVLPDWENMKSLNFNPEMYIKQY
jgi:hypothetical protein